MSETSLYRRIVSGEAGAWASPVRGLLGGLECLYRAGVRWRNRRFDRRGPTHRLDVPIVSVGNLTVGGTGKTPLVIELAKRLERMGLSPAVVSRGYKADADAGNDEAMLIRRRCPSVPCVSNADRAWAARVAVKRCGADVIILDDGFQHRRLERALDIVVVDATNPFGFDHLLPRGLLREPVSSLRRADLVVLSRCDQASTADIDAIMSRIGRVAPNVACVKCRHRTDSIEGLNGDVRAGSLEGRRVLLFAGIGNPRSFATSVRSMGADVVDCVWWPDHHRYRRRDLDRLLVERVPPVDLLLTTEKDAVKLRLLEGIDASRIGVVCVSIDFLDDGDTILAGLLEQRLRTA